MYLEPYNHGLRGTIPWAGLVALLALLGASGGPAAHAAGCQLFCPARQEINGLLEPILVRAGDLDEQGTPDLVVISEEIPGDVTKGSVTVFLADGLGGYAQGFTRVIEGTPTAAVLGQLDGDDHLDLVVAHFLARTLSFLPGLGDGGFAPTQTIPLTSGPTALAAVEFTGDPATDLIVVTAPTGFPGTARVYQGDGLGGFTEIATAPTDTDPRDVVVGRFTADAILDIVVGNRLGQSITLIEGAGSGLLGTATDIGTGAAADSISTGDLNNDSFPDIVTGGDTAASSIVTLLGDGAGGFNVGDTIAVGSSVTSVAACDWDQDDRLDVMAAKLAADTVTLLRGMGDGTFAPRTDFGANTRPRDLVAVDLNNDDFCDTAAANQVGGSISIYLGDGLGNVGTPAFTTGSTPLSVAAGDLDGDGLFDLVTADRDSNTVSVFLGDGEGGMTRSQALPSGPYPGSVTLRDVTGEGQIDIIVGNQGPPGSNQASTVEVFQEDGLGGFVSLVELTAGRLILDVISEDFDGDGLFDIAAANGNSDTISVFLSQGFGSFGSRKNSKCGAQPRSMAALHVDGDGVLDLAVSEGVANRINLLLGAGNGTFTESGSTLPGSGLNVDEVISADFNDDGFPDLAWLDQHGVIAPATLRIFLHDGIAGFLEAPSSGLPTGTFAESLAALDMDRSGGLDIAVVNRFDDTAQVFFGDGAGGFTDGGIVGTGHEPFAIAVADYNRDGREDLATADFNGDAVSVLLNNTFINDGFDTLLPASPSTWTWDPVPGADSYNVYRGDAEILRLKDYGICLDQVSSSTFSDPDLPAAGRGFFYVASAVSGGVESSMGFTSGCVKRVNRAPCGAP